MNWVKVLLGCFIRGFQGYRKCNRKTKTWMTRDCHVIYTKDTYCILSLDDAIENNKAKNRRQYEIIDINLYFRTLMLLPLLNGNIILFMLSTFVFLWLSFLVTFPLMLLLTTSNKVMAIIVKISWYKT